MGLDSRIISTVIDADAEGQRLDVWLTKRFTYNTRAKWQKIVRSGQISINGSPCRNSRVLKSGDTVSYEPDFEEPQVDATYSIEFEDENILIVNKSGFMPCHPSGPFFKNTLWWLLSKEYGEIFVVNRLDRETSGLVTVAKNSVTASKLSDIFASGNVEKRYIAIVFGDFPDSMEAEGWLMPDGKSRVRKKRRFVENINITRSENQEDSESAHTFFRKISGNGKLSIVEALPSTGRLHQIRATLCSLGYPLAGDKLYGPDDEIFLRFAEDCMTDEDAKKLILPRQALHAYSLRFIHPYTKKEIVCKISIPGDFRALYKDIGGVY